MNLSQDEINDLLTNDPVDEEAVEIMSPEAIAAMLDETAVADAPADVTETVQIMPTEAIADMISETANSGADDNSIIIARENNDIDDLFNRYEERTLPPIDMDAASLPLVGQNGLLTPEEVDILGEVGNISMGAVATTMYSLLDRRVSITTPRVSVFDVKDVLSIYKIPFVVATIEYVEGISGTNLLVLKVDDAAMITDILMGGNGAVEHPIELNEIHLSAMSEIMNQMMGASSTSLSKLLQMPINISPPKSSQVDVGFDVTTLLGDVAKVTKISFDMEIEGLLNSELIQLMPYEVSRDFAKRFMEIGMGMPDGENETKAAAPTQPIPKPSPAATETPSMAQSVSMPPPPPPISQAVPPAPEQQQPASLPMQQAGQYPQTPFPQDAQYLQSPYPQPIYPQSPYPQSLYPQSPYQGNQYPSSAAYPPSRLVDVHPVQFQAFDAPCAPGEQKGIDLVYNIPLQVTVELGKTKKEISEILEFGSGTIVVLDKMAGEPVEIVVNGKLIARGEVVVIDDNYGVRITDIIS